MSKKPLKKRAMTSSLPKKSMPDEAALFTRVSAIIEKRKHRAAAYANREVTLMFWEVGKYIGSVLLDGARGKYGDQIVSGLSTQLATKYGNTSVIVFFDNILVRHHIDK